MSNEQPVGLRKAAADPQKLIDLIQQLRNEVEKAGELDAADLYTQAISLILQASGEAEQPENGEQPAEQASVEGGAATPPPEGAELPKSAPAGKLGKAGRMFSGSSSQAMHGVIKTLAEMLSKGGDELGVKIAALYAPAAGEAEKAAQADLQKRFEGLVKSDDLSKALNALGQEIAGELAKYVTRFDQIEHRLAQAEALAASGGPVLSEARAMTPGAIEGADLAKLLSQIKDPAEREALGQQITAWQIRRVQSREMVGR